MRHATRREAAAAVSLRGERAPARRAPEPAAAQLRALRRKYQELWSKHRALTEQAARAAADRAGVLALALFAVRVSDDALAVADREHVRFRSSRWYALERDRTPWRATARDTAAPASAPTLLHLAASAADALLARSGPELAAARYERPERGDVFDVRFERLPDAAAIGVVVRDVTRLLAAERRLAALASPGEDAAGGGPSTRGRGAHAPRG